MTDNLDSRSRRIAKNTMMLYIRMFFMMLVGLYTSRVVLEALGENDYGIYSVIGGVVAMFTMLSGSLNAAVSRFITFELGKGEDGRLTTVFSTAVITQLLISLIVVLIAEPVGLWFIDEKMTIDPSRIQSARWVLHFSILAFVVNLMSVPQMALITAHERMSAYAYIGILDAILRLGVALFISRSASDRLILYSAFMAMTVIVVRLAYGIYSRRSFPECRFRLVFDRGLTKEIFAFSGWNFIGASSGVLRDQGGNILINLFFSPAVNAARGIAVQLNGTVQGFVNNFMTAVNPQITKSYASGDYDYMFSLVRKSSRMSFYLLFIIAFPVIFNSEYLLELWLKEVPQRADLFVKLFLVFSLSESMSLSLITLQLATGKVRDYQIIVGGLQLLNLPVSYACLKLGCMPESTVMVAIVISQICFFARLFMLRRMTGLDFKDFVRKVYFNIIKVVVAASFLPLFLCRYLPDTFAGFVLGVILCLACAALSLFFVGCSRVERDELVSMFRKRMKI